jgi:hypothetical protein
MVRKELYLKLCLSTCGFEGGDWGKCIEHWKFFSKAFSDPPAHKDYSNKIEILPPSYKNNDRIVKPGSKYFYKNKNNFKILNQKMISMIEW